MYTMNDAEGLASPPNPPARAGRSPYNDELTKTLTNLDGSSKTSKGVYRSLYKRLMGLSGDKKLLDMSETNIIKLFDDESIPPKSQEALANVAAMIRNNNGASHSKINKFKDTTIKKRILAYKMEKNKALKDTLPDKKELDNYLKSLFVDKDYVGYIINFLLLNYGVRNKDLNCIITGDSDVIFKGHDTKHNYLYVTFRYVFYVRNDYKTYETYGRKVLKIERRPFQTACKALLDGNYDIPLLKLKNDEPISEDSVGKIVQRHTYNELGEGKYMKILVMAAKKDGNIKRIEELSKSRGTAIETILTEYDIDNQ